MRYKNFDEVEDIVEKAMKSMDETLENSLRGNFERPYKNTRKYDVTKKEENKELKEHDKYYKSLIPEKILYTSALAISSVLGASFMIATIPIAILGKGIAFGIITWFLIFFIIILGLSIKNIKNINKFEKYKKLISSLGNDFFKIDDLALATNESKKKTVKRLKKMIDKGWFKEGYIDKSETTIIVTTETYRLYKKSEEEFERRQVKEKLEETKDLDKELKKVLDIGKNYLSQLSELNFRIEDEVVSEKISKIEKLTAKILKRVEEEPSSKEYIKKLMKYYLPMTIKLLKAYEKLTDENLSSEHIAKSKHDIEQALDNLNEGFSNLLDKLYMDVAMDIESDISVLNMMLKREGLNENDFEKED